MKPLEGFRVLDFAQFLAGPMAALRLSDLGAEVIKIERPQGGDLCRSLVIANQKVGSDSLLFHTINRGKNSVCADLKEPADLSRVKELIGDVDVMIHNFRPGVMERIGLGWNTVKALNKKIVYGAVTGYGAQGPLVRKPGQDLLVQALTGMPWLSGNSNDSPVPAGFAVLDITCGNHLVQGILAALLRRATTDRGALVEVDLMSSSLDMQFELFTAYLNGEGKMPSRSEIANANVSMGAPYGIYACSDGYIAIAMTPIPELGALIDLSALSAYQSEEDTFNKRDEIKSLLASHLATNTVAYWLARLEPADIWCAEVMDWLTLVETEGFKALEALQKIDLPNGNQAVTTRCPIRIDGEFYTNPRGGPLLGANTDAMMEQSNRA